MRTYGKLAVAGDSWVMSDIPPHVAMRLKHLFPRIPKTKVAPFTFPRDDMHCADLSWFMQRYPLEMTDEDRHQLTGGRLQFEERQAELERILLPNFLPMPSYPGLLDGNAIRPYQAQAIEVGYRRRALLLGDDLGLGKTYTSTGFCLKPGTLPAAVVVQTHLPRQWLEKITTFTSLRVHCIKGTRPYSLPPADIYIFKYSQLAGWVDFFTTCFFKTVIYDEIQELRTGDSSAKGQAALTLSRHVDFRWGLSATPIYGYGSEVWNIMRVLDESVLGDWPDFVREWCKETGSGKFAVKDPDALGTYLREQHVFIRRLKQDVGQQMPAVNVLQEIVESDGDALRSIEDLARQLAMRAMTGSFTERGQAGRELDMMVRQATGVGKAKHIAAFARILLEEGVPLMLVGWHRDVYEIWNRELADFRPVMYTGSESPRQKDEAVREFMEGKTNCFIISLRSGAGLDGLQHRCSTVLFGELDWSRKVHEQIIGRLDREGQKEQVTAVYLTCEDGSDPPIIDLIGLKESQARGIVDPGRGAEFVASDESRLKLLARQYLSRRQLAEMEHTTPVTTPAELVPSPDPHYQLELPA